LEHTTVGLGGLFQHNFEHNGSQIGVSMIEHNGSVSEHNGSVSDTDTP